MFADRSDAGRVLTGMLPDFRGTATTTAAVPAGGVPVAVVFAERLGLPVEVAVVSKVTPPGNTEACYGAVAFDGSRTAPDHTGRTVIRRARGAVAMMSIGAA